MPPPVAANFSDELEELEDVSEASTTSPSSSSVTEKGEHTSDTCPTSASPLDEETDVEGVAISSSESTVGKGSNPEPRDSQDSEELGDIAEYGKIERFFRHHWTHWMQKVRFFVLGAGLILFAVAIWRASLLRALSKDEEWLPETVTIRRAGIWLAEEYPVAQGSNQLSVAVVFGVAGLDQSDADRYNPNEFGSATFDADFSLRSVAQQQHLLDAVSYTHLTLPTILLV